MLKDFLESSGHMAGGGGVAPLRPLSSPPALPVTPFLSVSPSPGPLVSFPSYGHCNKNYTKRDMSLALEALRYSSCYEVTMSSSHVPQDQEAESVPRLRGLRHPTHHAVAESQQNGNTNTKEGDILQVMD